MNKRRTAFSKALVAMVCMAMLFAYLPTTTLAAAGDYNAGDVAVINAIIRNNALAGYNEDDPDNWTFVTWEGSAPDKRVRMLDLSGKNLTGTLDVSGLPSLASLTCSSNQLAGLNASGLALLTHVVCNDNQLASVNLSGCTSLLYLACHNNQLTSLDVSGLALLNILYSDQNRLTDLNVSGCTALSSLSCHFNQLTDLDVSGCTALNYLRCNNNQLTGLDVSGCTALDSLNCDDNRLAALDLSGLTQLGMFYGGNNPLAAFTAPNGNTLAISAGSGGHVVFGGTQGNSGAGYDLFTGEITLTAVPQSDTALDNWTGDIPGSGTVSDNPLVFTLDRNMAVTANFRSTAPGTYTVAYAAGGAENGNVPTDTFSPYTSGAMVTVLGNTGGLARTGYTFSGWVNSVDGQTYTQGQTFSMPPQNVTLTAKWNEGPSAPAITSANNYTCAAGTGGTFQVRAVGTPSTFTYSLDGAPAGVAIDSNTGLITIANTVAASTYAFTVRADNGVNPPASQAFTLTVGTNHTPINPPNPNTPIDLNKDAVLSFHGAFANIASIKLNGNLLTQISTGIHSADLSGYPGYAGVLGNAKDGGVVVTLYKEFLHTLPSGSHTLEVQFDDGGVISSGDVTFTIANDSPGTPASAPAGTPAGRPAAPQTGDGSNMALWSVLVLVSLGGMGGTVLYGKRRGRANRA